MEPILIIVWLSLLLPCFTLKMGVCCRVSHSGMREGTLVTSWAFVVLGMLQAVLLEAAVAGGARAVPRTHAGQWRG